MKFIHFTKLIILSIFIALLCIACNKDNWLERLKDDINYSLNNTILFPIATPESKIVVSTANDQTATFAESMYKCDTKKIKFSKPIETVSLAGLDASHLQVYPGTILQLKDLHEQGKFVSVEQFPRGTLSLKSSIAGSLPRKIELFNDGKAKAFVDEVSRNIRNREGFTSSYIAKEAYQAPQGFLELGIPPDWAKPTLTTLPNPNHGSDIAGKTVFLQFTQIHYSVELDAPPTNSAEFFNTNLKIEDFKKVATFENPLGYVNKVSYGVKVLVSMNNLGRNSPPHEVLVKKLNEIMQNGTIKIDEQSKEMFKSCLFSIVHVVSSANNRINPFSMIGVDFLSNLQNRLSNTSASSTPIEYQVRYLANHAPFIIQANIEYTDHQCRLLPTAVYISRIGFQYFSSPPPSSGAVTPIFRNPDVIYVVWNSEFKELERGQVAYSVLLSRGTFWYTSIKVPDLRSYIYVGIGSTIGGLGSVPFLLQDYIPKDGFSYPTKINKTVGNDQARLNISLELDWR
ncbi:MAG: thiol-activated cytolysin family protein [Thermoflexibacter sp.]|jgi:hypothetical protein|nr:thiol-activated cytolysin family protein [Thermoflexibacter sp.]